MVGRFAARARQVLFEIAKEYGSLIIRISPTGAAGSGARAHQALRF